VRDNVEDAKDQLRWKWQRGAITTQDDFGNPASDTTYTLCVYDSRSGATSLATSLSVDPSTLWQSKDPKGWLLVDKAGTSAGVQQFKLKPGAEVGKSSASLKARGLNLPTPTPAGTSIFFDQDPDVTVQLHNSEGKCWTSTFTSNLLNSAEQFKARTP